MLCRGTQTLAKTFYNLKTDTKGIYNLNFVSSFLQQMWKKRGLLGDPEREYWTESRMEARTNQLGGEHSKGNYKD